MTTPLQIAIEQARALTDERLIRFPNSPFFKYGLREISSIEDHYQRFGRFDRTFYDNINIGVMCARELESVDPGYSNVVYDMLEHIRLSI